MNNTKEHQQLVDDILFAVGSLPDVRLWPRRVGLAVPIDRDHPIFFGMKGETDLQGIVRVCINKKRLVGIHLAIEVKTGSGRLSPDQVLWRDMIIRFGGRYIEARSIDDALQGVNKMFEYFL